MSVGHKVLSVPLALLENLLNEVSKAHPDLREKLEPLAELVNVVSRVLKVFKASLEVLEQSVCLDRRENAE